MKKDGTIHVVDRFLSENDIRRDLLIPKMMMNGNVERLSTHHPIVVQKVDTGSFRIINALCLGLREVSILFHCWKLVDSKEEELNRLKVFFRKGDDGKFKKPEKDVLILGEFLIAFRPTPTQSIYYDVYDVVEASFSEENDRCVLVLDREVPFERVVFNLPLSRVKLGMDVVCVGTADPRLCLPPYVIAILINILCHSKDPDSKSKDKSKVELKDLVLQNYDQLIVEVDVLLKFVKTKIVSLEDLASTILSHSNTEENKSYLSEILSEIFFVAIKHVLYSRGLISSNWYSYPEVSVSFKDFSSQANRDSIKYLLEKISNSNLKKMCSNREYLFKSFVNQLTVLEDVFISLGEFGKQFYEEKRFTPIVDKVFAMYVHGGRWKSFQQRRDYESYKKGFLDAPTSFHHIEIGNVFNPLNLWGKVIKPDYDQDDIDDTTSDSFSRECLRVWEILHYGASFISPSRENEEDSSTKVKEVFLDHSSLNTMCGSAVHVKFDVQKTVSEKNYFLRFVIGCCRAEAFEPSKNVCYVPKYRYPSLFVSEFDLYGFLNREKELRSIISLWEEKDKMLAELMSQILEEYKSENELTIQNIQKRRKEKMKPPEKKEKVIGHGFKENGRENEFRKFWDKYIDHRHVLTSIYSEVFKRLGKEKKPNQKKGPPNKLLHLRMILD